MKLTKKDILQFLNLTKEIKDNCPRHSSQLNDILRCDEYDKLVEMGIKIIPLLIGELLHRQFWWFGLIDEISAKDESFVEYNNLSVPDSAKGKLDELCKIYISWAFSNNIKILVAQEDGTLNRSQLPPHKQLLETARKNRPPQSWFDKDEESLF